MFNYITTEEYYKMQQSNPQTKDSHTLKELNRMASSRSECIVCGQPAWKLGNCNLCFSCTTGESDDSDDYELVETK